MMVNKELEVGILVCRRTVGIDIMNTVWYSESLSCPAYIKHHIAAVLLVQRVTILVIRGTVSFVPSKHSSNKHSHTVSRIIQLLYLTC